MKDKRVSDEEYVSILTTTAVVVILLMLSVFAGGAYAITRIFNLQWYQGVALFLLFVAIWSRRLK
jgi:hypothetical protein